LRIKGCATSESLAEIVALAVERVEENLHALAHSGHAMFRTARSLWQITPEGREAHRRVLEETLEHESIRSLAAHYGAFLEINTRFKSLCGEWQIRGDQPNDHSDVEYDSAVVSRLVDLNERAQPIVASMSEVLARLATYGPRLNAACRGVAAGNRQLFTGVMCGSFHDIWMELHEDLILTQGIDRAAEGSF
jgi:hypothetical protein